MKNNFYAVIMAGGVGTRLWPVSRRKTPKQFHPIGGENPLLRETFLRLLPLFSPKEIIISTVPEFVAKIKKMLPEIPVKNYIVEPALRGNAPACGLVSATLEQRDPSSGAIFLPADALIQNPKEFIETIKIAKQLLDKNPDHIIALGILPTKPAVDFGYIEIEKKINFPSVVYQMKRFVEKPDVVTAEKYLISKKFYWNAGIFIWKNSHILNLYKKYMPETHLVLEKIVEAIGTKDEKKVLKIEYAKTEKTSIDYGIMEKIKEIYVIPADFGWSDAGTWGSLLEALSGKDNVSIVENGQHIGVDSKNCLVWAGKKLIATVGLKDIAIIDTPDALLVCNTKESHKIKDLLQKLDEKLL
jgi:mannose-1-phosphate guanylyltransferase